MVSEKKMGFRKTCGNTTDKRDYALELIKPKKLKLGCQKIAVLDVDADGNGRL